MPSAGDLIERISFQRRSDVADEYGNTQATWDAEFDRRALFIMRPGSEAAFGARLEGRQPVTIIVQYDAQTATITSDWRAIDQRTGKVYAIHTAGDMERKRQWLSIVAESGAGD